MTSQSSLKEGKLKEETPKTKETCQKDGKESKDNKTAVDATYGRRTRAVLIMDSGHIILSAVQPETVGGRIDKTISQDDGGKQIAEAIK